MAELILGETSKNQGALWMIRIRSEKPTVIDFSEEMRGDGNDVNNRAYQLARRTSYMVNGPNREVMVSVERFSFRRAKWITVFQLKTKLKDGAGPKWNGQILNEGMTYEP